MKTNTAMTRRAALTTLAAGPGAVLAAGQIRAEEIPTPDTVDARQGRLKQAVCRWCFGRLDLDDLAREVAAMGMVGIDLLSEEEWPVVQRHGLTCTMANGPGGLSDGWNTPDNHAALIKRSEELMPKIAEAGLHNMIVFSGNRRGISDDEGIANCARGLEKILPLAESLDITLYMELLNSKRNHPDYQCDHTVWGAALAKQLDAPRFKLLYDIYHMQVMEGDIIATIQENIEYIGHFHTAGVPGRNEIDETQELNYRRISKAIADTGFDGYFAHEFAPRRRDGLASLRQAVAICTV